MLISSSVHICVREAELASSPLGGREGRAGVGGEQGPLRQDVGGKGQES